MLFHSYHFLLFLPVVVLIYRWLQPGARVLWLAAASCYFYAQLIPAYLLVMFLMVAIDYSAGLWMAASQGLLRRLGMVFSLVGNLALLGVFKYWDFVGQNLAPLGVDWPPFGWPLPVGLSFHTFQSLAYTFEVYYGRYAAERNPLRFLAYVLFFPQLVAGPIERPHNLLSQLHKTQLASWERIGSGLRLMLLGYLKKVVVADTLAPLVDRVYVQPGEQLGPALALATLYFAFQLYCDFSGYTDMALGCARVLGFELCENFRRPFLATSMRDFWRRWHISLGSWFRDYVYLPLRPRSGLVVAALLTFVLSGLWHGPHWKFVLWGLYHGFLVSIDGRLPLALKRGWLGRGLMMILLLLSMPLFRAGSLGDALYVLTNLTAAGADTLPLWPVLLIVAVYGLEYLQEQGRRLATPLGAEMVCVYSLIIVALVTYSELVHTGAQGLRQFVYFQF
jgi:D-alanyl-lipoteichoic acid acyltransferase DltB (MBOAT superfamily)